MSSGVLSTKSDLYRTITEKIVRAIEAGAGEFVMPWHSKGGVPIARPRNAATRNPYRGVNVVALWAEASTVGHGSGEWATYRQWQQLGCQVRRGEQGSMIIFYKRLDDPLQDEGAHEDEEGHRSRFLARASYVFNSEQVDGREPIEPPTSTIETLDRVEQFVCATGAAIKHGGTRACYVPRVDRIEMPDRARFIETPGGTATEGYYSTLLHELTHWTGAAHRLDRTFGKRFGDHDYAVEELVAELGAAFLCADLGVSNQPRPDHAAYVANWLEVLGRDSRAIFTASKLAADAAQHLTSLAPA